MERAGNVSERVKQTGYRGVRDGLETGSDGEQKSKREG